MKTSIGANFIRSTKAPTISAGVIAAKVIWNIMKTDLGNDRREPGRAGGYSLQIEGPTVDRDAAQHHPAEVADPLHCRR